MKNEYKLLHRILVIDDNTSIYENFCKILVNSQNLGDELQEMESELFGPEAETILPAVYELDYASQGKEGLAHALTRKWELNREIQGRLNQLAYYDCLKIDHSFVNTIGGNTKDQSVISAIIAMAEGMDLRVIAEGVETAGQAEFLRGKKCQEVQGYLYSRPLSTQQADVFFKQMSEKK